MSGELIAEVQRRLDTFTYPSFDRGVVEKLLAELADSKSSLRAVEAERVKEWNARREAEGARDLEKALCKTAEAERDSWKSGVLKLEKIADDWREEYEAVRQELAEAHYENDCLRAQRKAAESREKQLRAALEERDEAAINILPYLIWTISDESPGHHPTMPSAVSDFRVRNGLGTDEKLMRVKLRLRGHSPEKIEEILRARSALASKEGGNG